MPEAVPRVTADRESSHSIFTTPLPGKYYHYPQLTNCEMDAIKVTCMAKLGREPRSWLHSMNPWSPPLFLHGGALWEIREGFWRRGQVTLMQNLTADQPEHILCYWGLRREKSMTEYAIKFALKAYYQDDCLQSLRIQLPARSTLFYFIL